MVNATLLCALQDIINTNQNVFCVKIILKFMNASIHANLYLWEVMMLQDNWLMINVYMFAKIKENIMLEEDASVEEDSIE